MLRQVVIEAILGADARIVMSWGLLTKHVTDGRKVVDDPHQLYQSTAYYPTRNRSRTAAKASMYWG